MEFLYSSLIAITPEQLVMYLIGAVLISALLLILTIWLPQAQVIFGTAGISGEILRQSLGFAFAVPVISSIFRLGRKKEKI